MPCTDLVSWFYATSCFVCRAACVVLVLGDEGEDKYLVAYIVLESSDTSKKDVRAALKTRLPFYMIPSYFVVLSG